MKILAGQSVQDAFLNTWRKDRTLVLVYLRNGVKVMGVIRSFDKFCVLLENSTQDSLIFKHAISTIYRVPGSKITPDPQL